MKNLSAQSSPEQATQQKLSEYYKLHSKIYDISRWFFLFGRSSLMKKLVANAITPNVILEVGCGTGKNLKLLSKLYPKSILMGMDLSTNMLSIAQKKLNDEPGVFLLNQAFDEADFPFKGKVDLIIFSYVLTMNKDYPNILKEAQKTLSKNGHIAIVDFNDTTLTVFKKWMQYNHVTMNGELLKTVKANFQGLNVKVNQGIFSIWSYFSFIGKYN